jgi:Holliday junction resolvase-like predicted endonuclease
VKTRTSGSYGGPQSAVDNHKAARLRAAAYRYLDRHAMWDAPFRIDVIAVIARPDRRRARLEHIQSAIEDSG